LLGLYPIINHVKRKVMVKEKKMHRQKSVVNHTMNKVGGRKEKLRKTLNYIIGLSKIVFRDCP